MRELMVVEGGEELRAQLEQVSKAMGPELAQLAMLEACDPMRAKAVELAPMRRGVLKANIVLDPGKLEPGAATVGITVRKKAFYWRFVELGTRFMQAQPFMRPAYDQEKDGTVQRYGQRLRDHLRMMLGGSVE